jgi:hypothetical protein
VRSPLAPIEWERCNFFISSRRGRDKLTPCNGAPDQHFSWNEESAVTKQDKRELDRHFAWFEGKLPPKPARFVAWLRKPSSRLARIPLAILLIVGGFFSFLPVLGLWMLPLGLLLVAQDVPALQSPMSRMLGWIERKWEERIARSSG